MEKILDSAIAKLAFIDALYCQSDHYGKRQLIGSIYPEKLCFDGLSYRTAQMNEAARLMFLINSKLSAKKNRTKLDFSSLSDSVAGAGLEPTTFGL